MTGRDFILYILENGLENEPIFLDGKPNGFLTIEKAAVRLEFGVAAIKAWMDIGVIRYIEVEGEVYICPDDIERLRKRR